MLLFPSGLPTGFIPSDEILNAERPNLPPPPTIYYVEKHVRLFYINHHVIKWINLLNSYFFWCFSKFVWWYLLLPSDVPAEGPYISGMTIVQTNNKQHIYQIWQTNNKHMFITGSHEKCWKQAKRGAFDFKLFFFKV